MSKKKNFKEKIVVDEGNNLIFSSEESLYAHFSEEILKLEKDYLKLRKKTDISLKEHAKYEKNLDLLLEDPDEIWRDEELIKKDDLAASIFIKCIDKDKSLYHLAIAYLTEGVPSFIYLHFPTVDSDLINSYKRGDLIFDEIIKRAPIGAIAGDALLEGNALALSCYEAMMNLRSHNDILEENFGDYADMREESIEQADEIWRRNDLMGHILINFIKEFEEEGETIYYIVIAVEDNSSSSHALLFSFPTRDKNLVARYKIGENFQADEVVQESSH